MQEDELFTTWNITELQYEISSWWCESINFTVNRIGNIFIALFRAPSIKNSSNDWANRLFIVYMNHKSI